MQGHQEQVAQGCVQLGVEYSGKTVPALITLIRYLFFPCHSRVEFPLLQPVAIASHPIHLLL